MLSRALPRPDDFFPKTRRGHGSTHNGQCQNPACILNHPKSEKAELHTNQKENVGDWLEERRHDRKDDIRYACL